MLYLYLFLLISVTVINGLLALFIFQKNTRSQQNRMYSYTILLLVVWGLGVFMEKIATTKDIAIIGSKIAGLGYIFMPAFFLYFVLSFTKAKTVWNSLFFYVLIFFLPVVFLYLYWNTSFIISGYTFSSFGFSPVFEWLFMGQIMYVLLYLLISLILCYRFYLRTSFRRERIQALLILLGTGIPIILGLIVDGISFFRGGFFFNFSVLFSVINTGFITYAIVKYRFLSLPELLNADLILSAIRDVVLVIDKNFQIVRINESGMKLVHFELSDIKGKKIQDFLKGIKEISNILNPNKKLKNVKPYLYTREKHKIPVHITKQVIVDAGGDAMGAVIVARDIRDSELIDSKKRLRSNLQKKLEDLESFSQSIKRIS